MNVERYHPTSVQEILQLAEQASSGKESIVAQAGHFLLFYDERAQEVRACIADQSHVITTSIFDSFGYFPLLTWELGLDILKWSPCPVKEVLLLVNDWQYLPKSVHRNDFYAKKHDLPSAFRSRLEQHCEVRLMKPTMDTDEAVTGIFFGETHLRNRYKKRLAKLIRNKLLPPDVLVTSNGEHLTCTMSLSGGYPTEIYCSGKSADCSAEVAELLLQTSAARPNAIFINLYPIICRDFVENGTLLAARMNEFRLSSVVNIGFPASRVFQQADLLQGCELSIHRFE